MARGLRDDFRTIWQITTLRYALVGISALMFTVAGIGAWLPQFHERFSGMTEKQATGLVGALIIFGGIPGVLFGGHLADRLATRVKGARVAIPAYCIFVGNTFLILSYLPVPAAASVFFQLLGIFAITSAIPALRAGMADAVPAHFRGAGFGAFNLVSILFGAAAAPIIVGALADVWNLRVAFLIVSPPVYIGAWILFLARNHLDADALKIFEAVVRARYRTSRSAPRPRTFVGRIAWLDARAPDRTGGTARRARGAGRPVLERRLGTSDSLRGLGRRRRSPTPRANRRDRDPRARAASSRPSPTG